MTHYTRLEQKEDLQYLQNLLNKFISKLKSDPSLVDDSVENIIRIHDALHSAGPIETVKNSIPPKENVKAPAKRKRRTKEEIAADAAALPNLCSVHIHYAAKMPPKIDCQECWDAYKRFQPMQHEKKYRDFLRKSRQIASLNATSQKFPSDY